MTYKTSSELLEGIKFDATERLMSLDTKRDFHLQLAHTLMQLLEKATSPSADFTSALDEQMKAVTQFQNVKILATPLNNEGVGGTVVALEVDVPEGSTLAVTSDNTNLAFQITDI